MCGSHLTFFSKCFIKVKVVQLYDNIDTAWKKSCFILVEIKIFFVHKPSITLHDFPMHMLTSLFIDEILLPSYVNLFINFRGFSFREKMISSLNKHELSFIYIHIETNMSCCLLQIMPQRFGWGGFICKEH